MLEQEIPSVKDALNEYFRLKEKFENENKVYKRKIINNPTLSKREKRAEYLKLMPKCVNCKRPSKKGTIFSNIFNPSDDNIESFRSLKASCGVLADPCNLNIEINLGQYESLDKLINDIRNEIIEYKNKIINDKNKLLFGLITSETVLENFDFNKSYINDLTSIYENYLDIWNSNLDNQEKKLELDESITISYENIDRIKDCIKKMNQTNDVQFAVDAANIYYTTLEPLLKKIRQLKYNSTTVYHDDTNDTCRLIQSKYTTDDLLFSSFTSKVISYDVGLKAKKIDKKKKALFIIESDEEKDKPQILPSSKQKPLFIEDEPIIGQGDDGIEWNEPEYKKLWSRLPPKLKTAFKLNIDWMKEFMKKCVNERISKPIGWNGCKLPTPPNIVIPPKKMENGQYDFGISIYNEAFNKLSQSVQNTYLTFYKEDEVTKEKNYEMLENAMNELIQREVGFVRGFF